MKFEIYGMVKEERSEGIEKFFSIVIISAKAGNTGIQS